MHEHLRVSDDVGPIWGQSLTKICQRVGVEKTHHRKGRKNQEKIANVVNGFSFSWWVLKEFESTVHVTQSKQTCFTNLKKQVNRCLELTVLKQFLWQWENPVCLHWFQSDNLWKSNHFLFLWGCVYSKLGRLSSIFNARKVIIMIVVDSMLRQCPSALHDVSK